MPHQHRASRGAPDAGAKRSRPVERRSWLNPFRSKSLVQPFFAAAQTLFRSNAGRANGCCAARKSGNSIVMGFLWGLLRTVFMFFAVIVAVLVVIDGTLLANLLGKKE
jgi:hypothetical protein